MQRLRDVISELEEAAPRMPQDMPYQHLQNALVMARSLLADMEAASVVTVEPVTPVDPVTTPDPVLL
jgi:hypothetical protein